MTEHDKNVICSSVSDAADDIAAAHEVVNAYIKELARILLRELGSDAAELYVYGQPERAPLDYVCNIVREACGTVRDCNRVYAGFCRHFTALYTDKFGIPAESYMFPHQSEPKNTAAYVSGGASDAAYEIFSDRYRLDAIRSERIQNICDEVFDGGAGYCILPIRNSVDGRLSSFYRMINLYDLKIVSVCDVAATDVIMRFALCARSLCIMRETPRFMELSLGADTDTVREITDTARNCGHTLTDIITAPGGADDSICGFTFSLSSDYRPFLLYLNLFRPRFTITGLYDA